MNHAARNIGKSIDIRELGLQGYEPVWRAMQGVSNTRTESTADEIWFTEHPPVFTLGLNASRDHLLGPGDIPDVDLEPFSRINTCGFADLQVTDLRSLGVEDDLASVRRKLLPHLLEQLGIDAADVVSASSELPRLNRSAD